MKKINNYIIEKLKLNKDTKEETWNSHQECANQICSLLPEINDDIRKVIKDYCEENRVNSFYAYIDGEKSFINIFKTNQDYFRKKIIIDDHRKFDSLLKEFWGSKGTMKKLYDGKIKKSISILNINNILDVVYDGWAILFECNPYGELG